MKKIGALLLCILLIVSLVVPVFATEEAETPVVFTITPDKTSVAKGEMIICFISIDYPGELTSLGVQLNYDRTAFQFVEGMNLFEIKEPSLIPGKEKKVFPDVESFDDEKGYAICDDDPAVLSGDIAYFCLKALKDCPDTMEIGFKVAAQNKSKDLVSVAAPFTIDISGEHSFSDWAKADDDNHARSCSKCGDVETVAHAWVDGKITKEPSCKEEGAQAVVCECGATKTKVLPMTEDHTEVVLPAKDPTCTETGLTAGKQCSVCEKVLVKQEVIKENGHNEIIVPGKDETCTATGLTEGKKCSVCGETLVTQEVIPVVPHTEEVVPGKAATCTATGMTDGKKCSVCGKTLVAQEVIPVVSHTEEVVPGKAATCTAIGMTDGKKCSVCGKTLVAQEEIAKKPHTEEVIPAKAVTCTENGLTEGKKCSVCGETLVAQEVIVAEGHKDADKDEFCDVCGEDLRCKHPTTEVIPGKEATCSATGLTEGKKCSDCGEILVKQEEIAKKPHTEEVIPAKEATCTATGLTEGKKCSDCGKILVEQEEVAKKAHTEEVIPAKEATCTATGLTEGKKCSVCGEILVEQEEVAKKAHTEEVIPAKAVTCTENGLTEGKKCSVCGETLVAQEMIVAEGHKDADANEFCDVCNEDLSCKHPKTEVLPAKAATCTETGLTEGKKCSDCGDILIKQEIVPVVPHTFATTWKADETNHWHECVCGEKADVAEHVFTEGDLCDFCKFERDHVHRLSAVEAAEATCEKAGNKAHYACSGCEEWFEDAQGAVKITDKSLFIIEKLPHNDADKDQFCDDCKADLRPPVVPEEPKDDEFKTGDSSNVMLWSALLALSAMGAAACVITGKKKYNV